MTTLIKNDERWSFWRHCFKLDCIPVYGGCYQMSTGGSKIYSGRFAVPRPNNSFYHNNTSVRGISDHFKG